MPYRKTDPDRQRPTLLEYLQQHGWNKWRRQKIKSVQETDLREELLTNVSNGF